MKENDVCQEQKNELRQLGYSDAELERISPILGSIVLTGRIYLVHVFAAAKRGKRPFGLVMEKVQSAWDTVWSQGTSDRLGDPDDVAPLGVGMRNTCAFFQLYKDIGLPTPKML